jgi:hypothetical protein
VGAIISEGWAKSFRPGGRHHLGVPGAIVPEPGARSFRIAGRHRPESARLHRRAPAETDMQEYFRVSPPSVHQMVMTLERAGFIRKQPRVARSIELLVDPKLLPELL